MPGREELRELKEMIRGFHRALGEIHTLPTDDDEYNEDEYRGLLAELRQLEHLLDEKLPPVAGPPSS
jgi:hypothetical protein